MEHQEALLAEYQSLRQEILQGIQLTLQSTLVALPIAAAVMAYGFQAKSSIAFLTAIAVLLSSLWYCTYLLMSVRSIAAYVYAIIEPKVDGLQWETIQVIKRRREVTIYEG